MVQPIRADLGLTDVQIGLLQGVAFGLFYAVFAFPLGWLADRYSRQAVVFSCVIGWSLATTACGLAQTFWQLAVARFGVGIGEGGLTPSAFRMLADAFPRRRMALAIGIFGAGASIGGPLATILGGALVEWAQAGRHVLPLVGEVRPWQLVFLILGPPGALLAPLIFLTTKAAETNSEAAATPDAEQPPAEQGTYGAFLRSRATYLCLHFMSFTFIMVLAVAMAAWTPTFFQRRFGLAIGDIGLALGLVSGVAGVAGFMGGGWLADRWFASGRRDAHLRYFAIGMPIISISAVLAFAVVDRPAYAFALLAIPHLLMPFTGPAVAHLQMSTPEQFRGRTTALFTMSFNVIGMTAGPVAVAAMTEWLFKDPGKIGLSLAILAAVTGVLGTTSFLLALRPARRAIEAASVLYLQDPAPIPGRVGEADVRLEARFRFGKRSLNTICCRFYNRDGGHD